MRGLKKQIKGVVSIILAIVMVVGMVQWNYSLEAKAEDNDMKLLSTTDEVPWKTNSSTMECVVNKLDKTVYVTKLRIQITKVPTGKSYKLFEVEILDANGNNIAKKATASVHGESFTSVEAGPIKNINDGYYKNSSESWSYFKREKGTTTTPTDEYIEFVFSEMVAVSEIQFWSNWCKSGDNGDAPFNWKIYGDVEEELVYSTGSKVPWTAYDSEFYSGALESSVVTFDSQVSLTTLRIQITRISSWNSYKLFEVEILDLNGNNIAGKATASVQGGCTTNYGTVEHINDGYYESWSYFKREKGTTNTPTDEYIEFTFNEKVAVSEIRLWSSWSYNGNGGGDAPLGWTIYAYNAPSLTFIDDEYKLDNTNKIVSCVPAGTTAMEVLNKLEVSAIGTATADIYDGANKVGNSAQLKTGNVLRLSDDTKTYAEYAIAVFGDVDGDGQATIADTVYVEKNLDTLTTLQKYAASLNGWNVIGDSGAIVWKSADEVVESHKVDFDVIPENITSLRLGINVTNHNKTYQLSELKLYGTDGTNLAPTATLTVEEGMATDYLDKLINGYTDDWYYKYAGNDYITTHLEGEYFTFKWSSPVTICSVELFSMYAKSVAPENFDVAYDFGEAVASEKLVNQAVLSSYEPQAELLYSDEYVQEIANTVASNSGLSFTFVTDTHIDGRSMYGNPSLEHLSNVTRISNLLPVDAIVHGGDLIDGVGVRTRSLNYISQGVSTLVKESKVPVLMTQGNHDDNSAYLYLDNRPSQHITAQDWYWNVTRNLEQYNIVQNEADLDGNYYYVDYENEKIRMLVVNTNDLPYVLNDDGSLKYLASNGDFAISNEQLNWIGDVALDFSGKEDWGLVVISHVPLHYPDDTEAQKSRNSEILTDMLEAFMNGSSYTSPVYAGDFAQSVSVDFTTQGTRDVIACIAGHNHKDLSKEINGIWYITSAASLANTRSYNTTDEDAFDIFTIDKENRKIHVTRFGYGEDREFTY